MLHPELIRLGFIEYVEVLKGLGHDRVFPDLYAPGITHRPADRLSRELEPLRKTSGIALHQFRRLFDEELEQQRATLEVRAELMGLLAHTEIEGGDCDRGKLGEQMIVLLKLPVRTAHVQRKPIQLLPWVAQRQSAPWSRLGTKA